MNDSPIEDNLPLSKKDSCIALAKVRIYCNQDVVTLYN